MRPGYGGMPPSGPMMQHQMRPRHHAPAPMPGTMASVYQGVAEKIGSGIIDDPLEAFERIMREKERLKDERRGQGDVGSPSRRRSRSPENRRRSPEMRRRSPRRNSPDMRRNRSPIDKRGRSTGERRSPDERRRRRSGSFHSRSRSFSRYDIVDMQ